MLVALHAFDFRMLTVDIPLVLDPNFDLLQY